MRVALLLLSIACAPVFAADRLAGYGAAAGAITVSGVSSGGYMAIQFQVAHSNRVKGVAVLAAGPYYCAQGSMWAAYYNCMTPTAWADLPTIDALKAQAERYAADGRIDPTANLAGTRLWFFSGSRDRTVERAVVEAAAKFYGAFGAKNVPIQSRPAGHGMVTQQSGGACMRTEPPFINDCDYDAAGARLVQLLGVLKPPSLKDEGTVIPFDQKPFAGGDAYALALGDTGYAYVPAACLRERCSIHVAFHGCRQGADTVGERFVLEAGYNRWADTNRLIILYPQAIARFGVGYSGGHWSYVYNPRGCWDWWGYTDAQYATKAGAQIRAVLAMVERLAAPR